MKNVALVLFGILAGGSLFGLAIRPVLAQDAPDAASHRRWQQFCEPVTSVQEASTIAAARGADGWELVAYGSGALCFKRPGAPPRHDTTWPGY